MRTTQILCAVATALFLHACDDDSSQLATRPEPATGEFGFRLSASVASRISVDADSVRIRVTARGREVIQTFPANVPGELVVARLPPAKAATVVVEAFDSPDVVTWSGSSQVDIVGGRRSTATVTLRPVYGSLDVELVLDSLVDSFPEVPAPRFDAAQWGASEIPLVNLRLNRPMGTDSVVCTLASGASLRCDSLPLPLYLSQRVAAKSFAGRRVSHEIVDSVTVGGDFKLSRNAGALLGVHVQNGRIDIAPSNSNAQGWVAKLRYFESPTSPAPVITIVAPPGLVYDKDPVLRLKIGLGLWQAGRSFTVEWFASGVHFQSLIGGDGTTYGYDVSLRDFVGGVRWVLNPITLAEAKLDSISITVVPNRNFSQTRIPDSVTLEFRGLAIH